MVDRATAERLVGADLVYPARDHLIGHGTSLRLDLEVPEEVARNLERASGKRLQVAPDRYEINVHSLRRTGRITEASAALLDGLLSSLR